MFKIPFFHNCLALPSLQWMCESLLNGGAVVYGNGREEGERKCLFSLHYILFHHIDQKVCFNRCILIFFVVKLNACWSWKLCLFLLILLRTNISLTCPLHVPIMDANS